MTYDPCDPYRTLVSIAIDCQDNWRTDSDNLDYMATFHTPDEDDTETDAEQQRRDKAWVF